MNFETTETFDKEVKSLSKKYKNIKNDLIHFIESFNTIHQNAISIKNSIYKIRLKNSDKSKGKSSGYRVYYYIYHLETIYLLIIYDKSEIEMINEEILFDIIKNEVKI